MREVELTDEGRDAGRSKGGKAGGEIGQGAESAVRRIRHIETGDFAKNAKDPCEEDAPEDIASHLCHHEEGGEEDAKDGEYDGDAGGMEGTGQHGLLEGKEGDLGGRVADDDLRTGQADEADEEADTGRDGFLQIERDRIEDRFTDIREREHDEDDTLDEDGSQCHFPSVAHLLYDGEGEEGIQPHARCQGEGVIRKSGHEDSPQKTGDSGRCQDSALVHAGCAHDGRIDSQDVSHGHKGGDTRHDFRLDGCTVFTQVENSLQKPRFFLHGYAPFEIHYGNSYLL